MLFLSSAIHRASYARVAAVLMEEELKSYHVDRPEDSERSLFDDRGPSSSEDVTLEEEGVTVTGGRLPRFLNLLSKLRFRCRVSSCFFFSSSSRLSLWNRSRKDPSFENTFMLLWMGNNSEWYVQ